MSEDSSVQILVVMGVCGCGKTTTGEELARRLNYHFLEGDDFHPESNVQKMSIGTPLTDDDRIPWLEAMNVELQRSVSNRQSVVLACSALKERYRELLLTGVEAFSQVVHLKGEREVIGERLGSREGHFMPPELLESQLNTLEDPEGAIEIDVRLSPDQQVEQVLQHLNCS